MLKKQLDGDDKLPILTFPSTSVNALRQLMLPFHFRISKGTRKSYWQSTNFPDPSETLLSDYPPGSVKIEPLAPLHLLQSFVYKYFCTMQPETSQMPRTQTLKSAEILNEKVKQKGEIEVLNFSILPTHRASQMRW